LLFIGPAVAVIGIVAVVFVMRHKSVEKRSMYSSRRSQIEHKVRAARQRTLAPHGHADKGRPVEESTIPPAPTLTYEPSAFAGPPVAPPPKKTQGPQPVWDTGSTSAAAPSTPTYSAPVQPPAYEAPPYEAPAAEPAWTPTPEPAQPEPAAPAAAQSSSADAGAAWSVVGETKTANEPDAPKKKRSKQDAISQATGAWQLASGEAAGGEEAEDDGPKKPSAVIAIAQYALLVVGLVTVLIGVLVTVANSKVT
jgi:hypothetical protein